MIARQLCLPAALYPCPVMVMYLAVIPPSLSKAFVHDEVGCPGTTHILKIDFRSKSIRMSHHDYLATWPMNFTGHILFILSEILYVLLKNILLSG